MEKRYQVFVGSTFVDLADERRAVMQALLELDCIPAGMELFPTSDDDAWTLIERVIDDCDYYLVILAGRMGRRRRSQLYRKGMRLRGRRGQAGIGVSSRRPGIDSGKAHGSRP